MDCSENSHMNVLNDAHATHPLKGFPHNSNLNTTTTINVSYVKYYIQVFNTARDDENKIDESLRRIPHERT